MSSETKEKGANHVRVKFDRRNYRKHDDRNKKLIRKSLEELGAGRSVVIDAENELIAGNGVFEQAEVLGIKTRVIETDGSELVIVKRTDLHTDDEKRKKLALADNATSDSSDWDYENLAEDWNCEDLSQWGVDVPEDLWADPQLTATGQTEPDAIPEVHEDPVSCSGKVYQLGEHRLMCGDSTKMEDISELMGDELADMWLTDPPYNVAYVGKTADALTIKNDSMEDAKFRAFLVDAFNAATEHLKPGGAFYIWHADSEGYNFRGACHDIGLQVRQCLIWKKNSLVLGRQDYQWIHEPCLYGWKDGAGHYFTDDRTLTTVIEEDKPARSEDHPTMKSIKLFSRQIANSSKRGEVVLDTFGGSGTTLIACEQTGRKCRTMELDEHYCDVIRRRWAEFVHGEGCDWQALTPEIN